MSADDKALPALHPIRIRNALRVLESELESGADRVEFVALHAYTFKAALELIRKSQLALGLNANVVDRVTQAKELAASGLDFLEQIRDLMGKK
jgi:hypothetical protein